MDDCRRRFGEAFTLRLLGVPQPIVMISDPKALQALYAERDARLPAMRTFALRPIVGPASVLLLEGEAHLARRRLMLPMFHGERMRAWESAIEDVVEQEVRGWPLGEAFALHPRMQALTLEVIMRTIFGVSDQQRLARLRSLLRALLNRTASARFTFQVLLARQLGRPGPLTRLRGLTDEIDALLLEEIAGRRAESGAGEDMLSQLVGARFEDGGGMADAELRDQLMTLLLAGHETTATALAWTFDLLLRHPAALEQLTDELAAGAEERYTRAVVAEALRLRPVIPMAGRLLSSELRVAGFTLAPGTHVTPAVWLIHTRADLYPEPLRFAPERFLEDSPKTYSWVPFGGGSRRCLGASFAELEMRVVLRSVLRMHELHAAQRRPERPVRRNITLSPRRGVRVVARAR